MLFWNTHFFTFIVFILLILIWWFLFFSLFKKQNKISIILLVISYLFLIINIFEIKWWYTNWINNVEWTKIVFAVDISKSMLAKDIKKDDLRVSRLEWVKWLINDFINTNTLNKYGLIAFAWESLEVIPFTDDLWVFSTIMQWINNSNISKNGTDLSKVLNSIYTYFKSDKDWWLAVIFTDWWEDDIKVSDKLLDSFKKNNIKILIVWVWTKQWTKIPVAKDFFWRDIYKKYRWEDVIVKLNKDKLSDFANKYDFNFNSFDDFKDFKSINKFLANEIDYISLEKNINFRYDYTRFFIFISILFFTLFLINESILWKIKKL